MRVFLIFLIFLSSVFSSKYDFSLYKLGDDSNATLLIFGGIQGDEPGGFNAASLLVTHYKIKKGSVWVVPNLNFYSILLRSRGPYGDMNRKFARLSPTDPEFNIVQKAKELIKSPNVDMVINLHDGSGFYRPTWEDKWHNPSRWGQSCIVDQTAIESSKYGNLEKIAYRVRDHINSMLHKKEHQFSVKDTHTRDGDKEMEKSLTFFAINQGKPAFGNEASKNFGTHFRVYYHLLAVEEYMRIHGIEFERDFKLTPYWVKKAINNEDLKIVLYDNKLLLPVSNARNKLNFIPFKKGSDISYKANHPLVALLKKKEWYRVCYGNRRKAMLYPEYFEYDNSINTIQVQIDNNKKLVPLGTIINAKNEFLVDVPDGYRVNVIGWKKKGIENEKDVIIKKSEIAKYYSIDKKGKIFRVEIYKDDKFSGMVLVNFDDKKITPINKIASAK